MPKVKTLTDFDRLYAIYLLEGRRADLGKVKIGKALTLLRQRLEYHRHLPPDGTDAIEAAVQTIEDVIDVLDSDDA